jgi:hypothetical protein
MMIKYFIIVIICLLNFSSIFHCDTRNNEIDDSEEVKCCSNLTNQRVFVEFTTNIVQHEFIIQFKHYYKTETRKKYIFSALDNSKVKSHAKIRLLC